MDTVLLKMLPKKSFLATDMQTERLLDFYKVLTIYSRVSSESLEPFYLISYLCLDLNIFIEWDSDLPVFMDLQRV